MRNSEPTQKDIARFFDKVNMDGPIPPHCPELGNCWTWKACKNSRGYGQFGFARHVIKAHRFAWMIAHGPIPEGHQIAHRCDNPACVRHAGHLFLATPIENSADMVAKGRQRPARGERNGKATLTQEQVDEIRALFAQGAMPQRAIAAHFGIQKSLVSDIVGYTSWNPHRLPVTSQPRAKLTHEQVSDIRLRYAQGGISQSQLGRAFGVTRECIAGITQGKTWKT